MGMKKGHFILDPLNPEAYGICDRCSGMYNHSHLRPQKKLNGNTVVTTTLMVCSRCEDPLTPFKRNIPIPPDPLPVKNPRPIRPYGDLTGETPVYDGDAEYDDGEQYAD